MPPQANPQQMGVPPQQLQEQEQNGAPPQVYEQPPQEYAPVPLLCLASKPFWQRAEVLLSKLSLSPPLPHRALTRARWLAMPTSMTHDTQ